MNDDLQRAYKRGQIIIDQRTTFNVDRTKYLNASEAGGCIRAAWYSKRYPDKAYNPNGYAARGKHMETYIVDALRSANVPLMHAGDEQRSITDEKLRISATPDGAVCIEEAADFTVIARGIEFKTIDPRTNLANLPKPQHVVQLKIGMALMATEYSYDFRQHGGVLMYVNASNYDEVTYHDVAYDSTILDKYARRAKQVLNMQRPDSLDREGKSTGACRYCPFADVCSPGELEAPSKRRRAAHNSDLRYDVERYSLAKDEADKADAKLKAVKEDITQELEKREVSNITVAGMEVSLKHNPGKKTFDKKAAFARHPDLTDFEGTGKPFTTLTIKPAKI